MRKRTEIVVAQIVFIKTLKQMFLWEINLIFLFYNKNKIVHFHNYAYKKENPKIKKV